MALTTFRGGRIKHSGDISDSVYLAPPTCWARAPLLSSPPAAPFFYFSAPHTNSLALVPLFLLRLKLWDFTVSQPAVFSPLPPLFTLHLHMTDFSFSHLLQFCVHGSEWEEYFVTLQAHHTVHDASRCSFLSSHFLIDSPLSNHFEHTNLTRLLNC